MLQVHSLSGISIPGHVDIGSSDSWPGRFLLVDPRWEAAFGNIQELIQRWAQNVNIGLEIIISRPGIFSLVSPSIPVDQGHQPGFAEFCPAQLGALSPYSLELDSQPWIYFVNFFK